MAFHVQSIQKIHFYKISEQLFTIQGDVHKSDLEAPSFCNKKYCITADMKPKQLRTGTCLKEMKYSIDILLKKYYENKWPNLS